jgi:hypothetical protein
MSAAIGKSKKFISLCENVFISIKKITYKVSVWMIDKLKYSLILEKTYYKAAGLKLKKINDGLYSAIIFIFNRTEMIR